MLAWVREDSTREELRRGGVGRVSSIKLQNIKRETRRDMWKNWEGYLPSPLCGWVSAVWGGNLIPSTSTCFAPFLRAITISISCSWFCHNIQLIYYYTILLYFCKKSAVGLNSGEDNLSGCGKQMFLSLSSSHRHLERATECWYLIFKTSRDVNAHFLALGAEWLWVLWGFWWKTVPTW